MSPLVAKNIVNDFYKFSYPGKIKTQQVVLAEKIVNGESISPELKKQLKEKIPKEKKARKVVSYQELKLKFIIDMICKDYSLTKTEIFKTSRETEILFPRQLIQYLSASCFNINYSIIAKETGVNCRTTINNSVDKIERMSNEKPFFRIKLEEYVDKVQSKKFGE